MAAGWEGEAEKTVFVGVGALAGSGFVYGGSDEGFGGAFFTDVTPQGKSAGLGRCFWTEDFLGGGEDDAVIADHDAYGFAFKDGLEVVAQGFFLSGERHPAFQVQGIVGIGKVDLGAFLDGEEHFLQGAGAFFHAQLAVQELGLPEDLRREDGENSQCDETNSDRQLHG